MSARRMRQPSVNRKQIRAFAELDFVAKHVRIARSSGWVPHSIN
jgi:hypothetical protein